jgi:hypothetical protein
VAVLIAALACGQARATTVGGDTQSTEGPFVLSAGRIFLPTWVTDNSPDSGSTDTTGVSNFGVGSSYWSDRDLTDDGAGTPLLAAGGGAVAVTWYDTGPTLKSGRIQGGHLVGVTTHSTHGPSSSPAVAIAPDATRAVAWADSNGMFLQTVGPGGTAGPEVPLATDATDCIALSGSEGGAWWAVWRTPAGLFARRVAADGSTSVVRYLGPASETTGTGPPFLDASGDSCWRVKNDGHGGLWVGLPRAVLHVTAARVFAVGSDARPVVLAAAGARAAIVFRKGAHEIRVRLLAGGTKRTVRLAGRGVPIDAAVDRVTGKIYVLSHDAKENVRLTEIRSGGKHRSRALPFCRRRVHSQVEAAGGLIAVGCAGRYREADSVETGGDAQYGRNNLYVIMNWAKVLRRQTFFEGDYSY